MTDPDSTLSMQGTSGQRQEEKRETVAQIAARLREGEDLKLAYALQEEEFREHYSKNRNERTTMAKDGKISREEQIAEMERIEKERAEIARRDAELAQELARQMEQEENLARLEQDRLDAELAKRIQIELLRQQNEGRNGANSK